MDNLSSVYLVNQRLHVSGIFVTHHRTIYTQQLIRVVFLFDCLLVGRPTDGIPPDDGLQLCPKHIEFDWRDKLRIDSASSWFLLHRYAKSY